MINPIVILVLKEFQMDFKRCERSYDLGHLQAVLKDSFQETFEFTKSRFLKVSSKVSLKESLKTDGRWPETYDLSDPLKSI